MTSYEYIVLRQQITKILENGNESDLEELFNSTEQLDNSIVHKLIKHAFFQGQKKGRKEVKAHLSHALEII